MGHLDFQLLTRAQIGRRHAKTPRRHLFDGGAGCIARAQAPQVGQGGRVTGLVHIGEHPIAHRIFPAFTTVALAANAVEGNGQGFMGLAGEGPQAHATGTEAPADVVNTFHLLQRGWGWCDTEIQKIPQGGGGTLLQQLLVRGEVVIACSLGKGLVEHLGHIRTVEVIFAPRAVLHKAHKLQLAAAQFRKGLAVEGQGLTRQLCEGQACHTTGGATEGCSNQIGANAHGFKDLGAVITGQQGDADFREDFPQARFQGMAHVGLGLGSIHGGQLAALNELDGAGMVAPVTGGLPREPRANSAGAIANQASQVMSGPALCRLHNQGSPQSQACTNQVVVDSTRGQQRRNNAAHGAKTTILTIREDENLHTAAHRLLRLMAELLNGLLQAIRTRGNSK